MKNIFVSHSKEDKAIAKKLVGKLEATGLSCYVYSRDKNQGTDDELISKCSIFVLVLSKSSLTSDEQIKQLKSSFDSQCKIIPFKVGQFENTLTVQYFLHSLEWVDAYGDGFDEAYDILTEIIQENSPLSNIPVKKSKKTDTSSRKDSNIKKYLTYGIIAVIAIIALYVIFSGPGDKKTSDKNNTNLTKNDTPPEFVGKSLSENEKKIVGTWKLMDYEDSRILSNLEKQTLINDVTNLKQNVRLVFNSDRSFERKGFTPQPQQGYWEFDDIKNKILLTPTGTERKEEVNIMGLTEKSMIFIVTETIQTQDVKNEIVTTKLTFQKQ
jgi:hypothetical protein